MAGDFGFPINRHQPFSLKRAENAIKRWELAAAKASGNQGSVDGSLTREEIGQAQRQLKKQGFNSEALNWLGGNFGSADINNDNVLIATDVQASIQNKINAKG